MLDKLFPKKQNLEYSQDTIDILRLIRSENVGPRTFSNLIRLFGSARKALDNVGEYSVRGGRSKPIKICSEEEVLKEIQAHNKAGAKIITYQDLNFSELLLKIYDFPPALSYKGNIELLNAAKPIAIVGARNCSINSRGFALQIAKDLAAEGFVTVSGLAKGIDTATHAASIGNTIAVIAGGIDHIYPLENKKLFEQLAHQSLIIAELPIGTKPLAQHFPQRNRIISGLSLATVVIEASLKSGSLITANFALEQGRDIFAAPGFALDPRCMGTNKLIKDGAFLLESADDVISAFANDKNFKKVLEESENYGNNFTSFMESENLAINNGEREMVVKLLSSSPVSIELLSSMTNLPMPNIYTICLELELAGKIVRHVGNRISLLY